MRTMSRRCIPYTPNRRPLRELTIALVSNTGIYADGQEPFDTDNDITFRALAGDVATADLRVRHGHYDQSYAERDVNCVFPLDRLRELAGAGIIAGAATKHVTLGYSLNVRGLNEQAAPAIVDEIERSDADAVLLTAGCPHVCHRTIVTIQREIEMRGIVTVLITVSPEDSQQMGPPRAIFPRGFPAGAMMGPPDQPDLQRKVVLDALQRLVTPSEPGLIVEHVYPEVAWPLSRPT